ncbi:MAG: PAS domain S-box protein [Candidatus Aenigmarchaeota archaeon]|nr:PAS domain S-box protein [Candidatus Aenigmarchaeota archaeon]
MSKEERKNLIKKIVKVLVIADLIILSLSGLFFIYAIFELPITILIFSLKGLIIVSLVGLFFFIIFARKLTEEHYDSILLFEGVIHLGFILLAINASGGIYSKFLYFFYLLIIFTTLYSKALGLTLAGTILGYLVFDIFFYNRSEIINNPFAVWPQALFLLFVAGFSTIYSQRYQKALKEKRQVETTAEELTEDKSAAETLLSSIADGVYAVDNERKIVLFNKAAEEMTGWKQEDSLGIKCSTVMKLKNEQDVSVCEKDCPMLATWNSNQSIIRNDLSFVNKRHKTVQISGSYASIKNSKGEITGGICVFRDITKQKEVERLRNEFVSTASHELRTPITTLEGYISLALNSGICKIDQKAKEYMNKAHSTILTMANLVKNLLSVTKIEEGRLQPQAKSFNLKDLIKTVVSELSIQANAKGIKLDFKESTISFTGKRGVGRSLNVMADPESIREVLTNLIENAIKFTKQGEVTVSVIYDDDFANVCIADTGIGIPTDDVRHLFEKFYRVDNSATREVGGTGLGLYITRSLVEMFGGKIWVESEEGKGSKFYFTIPRAIA